MAAALLIIVVGFVYYFHEAPRHPERLWLVEEAAGVVVDESEVEAAAD